MSAATDSDTDAGTDTDAGSNGDALALPPTSANLGDSRRTPDSVSPGGIRVSVNTRHSGGLADNSEDDASANDSASNDSASNDSEANDSEVGELGLPLPENTQPLPRFANMVIFFEKLQGIHGSGAKLSRERLICSFTRAWKAKIGTDIYPAVRLWFPQEDDELRQLSKLREQQIGRAFVEAMAIPANNPDALQLTNVRKSSWATTSSSEDDSLPARIKKAVAQRFTTKDYSALTIADVTKLLVSFANANKAGRVDIAKQVVGVMNPEEIYWFVKIMLRSLSLHISERVFLRLFHENALQVYMVNKNLKTVCQQLWSPDFSVTERDRSVHLMSYFCPMKAKFIKGAAENMSTVVDLMKDAGQFYIEEKIDGERIQVHWERNTNAVKFFSRRGTDFTSSYGAIFGSGPGASGSGVSSDDDAPRLQDIVSPTTENCILDGEVVAWDPRTNDVCGQSKVRELANHNRGSSYRHLILVFDIVFHNGDVLTSQPLHERKARLKQVFPPDRQHLGAGRVQMLPYKVGHTAEDIAAEFKRVIGQMAEGLVVKNPQSRYELDGKSNSWVKVKPEFVDGYQGENMDLIVVGCYNSRGSTPRSGTRFSSYLCALRDENRPGRFVAFVRVGSGICLAMYDFINSTLEDKIFAAPRSPSWLELAAERPPDFYVRPEDSLVLEVKYSEISSVLSEKAPLNLKYGYGYSLRFPRYVQTRDDKDVNSSATIGDMLDLCRTEHRREASKQKRPDAPRLSLAKRIKRDLEGDIVPVIADVFHGHLFFVCGDVETPKYMTQADLSTVIRQHGGQVTPLYHPGATAIGDASLPKVVQLESDGVPVICPTFVFDCIANGKMFRPEPRHFYCNEVKSATPLVDSFDFSLFRTQSPEEIASTFDRIDVSRVTLSENRRMELLDFLAPPLAVAFKGMRFFSSEPLDMEFLVKQIVAYGNGTFVETPEAASHLLVRKKSQPEAENADSANSDPDPESADQKSQDGSSGQTIVDTTWIFDKWDLCT